MKSTCKTLKGKFNSFDLFGYKIPLNYKSREEYTTTAGAFFSILIRAFVIWFFAVRAVKLFTQNPENDKINQ